MKNHSVEDPLVSVVMPVLNAHSFLAPAIDSILAQTYTNFEFLILNDASEDGSLMVMNSYSDARIRIFDFTSRKGLVELLNSGISASQGEYIMRMDADDIAFPERMERQVHYLKSHPETGVCSSWTEPFNEKKSLGIAKGYSDDEFLKLELLYRPGFAHPSVMVRRELFRSVKYRIFHSDDYDLWTQLAFLTKFFKIPRCLLRYRMHSNQFTSQFVPKNREALLAVQSAFLQKVDISFPANYLKIHHDLTFYEYTFSKARLFRVACYFRSLRFQLDKNRFFDRVKGARYADDQLYNICAHFTKNGIDAFGVYFKERSVFDFRKILFLWLKSVRSFLFSSSSQRIKR